MITDEQHDRLRELQIEFLKENKNINLSALRDSESCWTGNVLDSLALLELDWTRTDTASLLDIGTGGGFPLLPLAICRPDWKLTGLDSTEKKLDAIRRIAASLDLTNINLLNGRAEKLAHETHHREAYDIVTARAVAPLNTLLELTIPFLKIGGHFIAWKSMHCESEIADSDAARKALGCSLVDRHTYALGGNWGERQLLVFRKTQITSNAYPRAIGIPKKQPLK